VQPLAISCDEVPSAVQLFDCIRQLGQQGSNPVYELLRDVPTFVRGDKYPQPALTFGEDRWRTYYHSHLAADADAGEHGHFHLFTRIGKGWAHLAGLSMDAEGQPLRWFVTNGWVTGGCWFERCSLPGAISLLAPSDEPDVLRRWLASLLQVYQGELHDLLRVRDIHVTDLQQRRPEHQVLGDRSLYELACEPVDLTAKLTSLLTGES
jgi:hypothetical protein